MADRVDLLFDPRQVPEHGPGDEAESDRQQGKTEEDSR